MRFRLVHQISFALVGLFVVGACLVNVDAQARRKRSRRITNPVINTPAQTSARQPSSTTDASIISTAEDENATENSVRTTNGRRTNRPAARESDSDSMRHTVNDLSSGFSKLTKKVEQIDDQQRALIELQRLSLEEQRLARIEQHTDKLREQLDKVLEKQSMLQSREDEVEFALKPENIERSVATFGTTRPEELREQRRRQLENEKTKIHTEADQLATERTRLEEAIATDDAETNRIRARIDAVSNASQNADANGNSTNASSDNSTTLIAPSSNPSDTSAIPQPPPRTTETTPSSTPR